MEKQLIDYLKRHKPAVLSALILEQAHHSLNMKEPETVITINTELTSYYITYEGKKVPLEVVDAARNMLDCLNNSCRSVVTVTRLIRSVFDCSLKNAKYAADRYLESGYLDEDIICSGPELINKGIC